MRNLAAALAIATSYLDRRSATSTEDGDIEVLEAVAAELQQAPSDEKNALISALVHIGRADLIDGLGLK
ncbi:hypothetical protein N1937_04135 [Rhizobium sp. WSM4643]|uniref:hypothetical protein n=1 Tax=Rhizobium sp. WSM4643 TaxID=3138253 RepID=UPI0021A4D657|nr:hypothetical protein [Rhizobium leguminosarum]UWM76444.1 hypothetical protein N1937_04135 [Rhizobium leguminosarum bv. viciae]